jgi:hypothetical protein
MNLSRGDIEEMIGIAKARVARIDALRAAIEAHEDPDRIIRLARAVCGLEADDEPQPDRIDPPLQC